MDTHKRRKDDICLFQGEILPPAVLRLRYEIEMGLDGKHHSPYQPIG